MSRPLLFGKYCLLERLSVGGMAEVFRARPINSPDTTRYLALKRILPHLAEDEEFIKMFVDEAKLCVHLRHPNIVHIFELGRFQSSSYILMEFIPGKDLLALQKRLRKRRLIMSVAQACYVCMELCKGLDYAHKATDDYGRPLNIIHRDVSPQNVLINYNGSVKLIDFGVAKAAVQSTKTQVGVLKGKFGYMSPEQIRGEAIDQRSDIFAVGTLLWELLTNRRLFTGDNEFEIFQKVRDAQVDPPSTKNPQVPPEVDRIVMKALSGDPNTRYTWAADVARDLGQFLTSIQPLYTQQHLSDWMARFFEEELAEEQGKVDRFREIRTADDVFAFYQAAPTSAEQREYEAAESTQVWDQDVAPTQGEDIEQFAANHTVVQAGGFDLDEFISLQDDDIVELDAPPVSADRETVELDAVNRAALRHSVAHTKLDSGNTNPGLQSPTRVIADATRRRNMRAGLALVAVLACAVLAISTLLLWLGGGEESQATTVGSVLVTGNPASGVQVFIDEQHKGTGLPLKVDALEPGAHVVELRRDGFHTFSTSVQVRPGSFVPVEAELVKKD